MGAWGPGVFENDTACDFASAVAEGGGLAALVEALDRVLSSDGDYLEAPDAEEGLAAAEIVARLKGSPGQQTAYAASIDAWIKGVQPRASGELIEKARQAIARILTGPSELKELWTESAAFEDWNRSVEEVSKRL